MPNLQGRAAVVSRHPATIRRVAQSLGAVGLGVTHALGPGNLPQVQEGDFRLAVVDLDVDPLAPPLGLVQATAEACPGAHIVAVAGVDAKRRLMGTLHAPRVRHVVPKLGSWLDRPPEQRLFDGPDESDLAISLRRLLLPNNEPLGVSPYLIDGFSTSEVVVRSSGEKQKALGAVLELAEALELSDEKKRRIEVATEELLLNALFDAPHDADGKPLFAGVDRRANVELPPDGLVRLQFGCDGRNFAVSVQDRYGTLERAQVVRSLVKLLHPEGPRPERGGSGAGLGFLLVYGAANQLVVHGVRQRFTEVTAVMHVSGSNRTVLARGSALHLYLDGR